MSNTIAIKEDLLLDKNLKPQEICLFLHLIRLCDRDTGIITISGVELMQEARMTNKGRMIRYLNNLIENRYIDKLENINKKSTYKINREHFFK
ncbi:hypothetical protein FDB55_03290 [Clostridium botulinum]|uniref:hypothetical protein n=1 Tax=Clostridium botulinum TaxID=1491 RepID=UPI0006A6F450|nr:hypothetical protein [Clostridium botulinum]KAI3350115.1 hypothetical protein CIT18_04360 [Clostridium botulinum]KOM88935.1 hypothetical protein ACP51_04150 [Clostridium botulinum]KOR63501.1 hypothetical protein ADT22_02935 [Clostridium botulinum]MCS6111513.1 hypothetical protein [Clostridium botulinum]NFE10933.1 hypothetical protein [Clostridium botulinum]